jgi:hypothetical protein
MKTFKNNTTNWIFRFGDEICPFQCKTFILHTMPNALEILSMFLISSVGVMATNLTFTFTSHYTLHTMSSIWSVFLVISSVITTNLIITWVSSKPIILMIKLQCFLQNWVLCYANNFHSDNNNVFDSLRYVINQNLTEEENLVLSSFSLEFPFLYYQELNVNCEVKTCWGKSNK